jgi:hypothetical protein
MLLVKYHLSEEEYFDYNYYTAWKAPDKKNYRIGYYLKVLLLYAAIAGFYIFTYPNYGIEVNLIIFATIGLVYFLLVPFLIKHSLHRKVKQILSHPENKHILEEAEVELSDTGILDKDAESESKYSWEAIVKKAETERSYFLYTNSHHAIVIPKRALRTTEDRKELERLLNENLPLSTEFG